MEFGKILKDARKQRGMTQKELAEKTGFTIRAISFWETGRREITLKNADVVARKLKITVTIGEN